MDDDHQRALSTIAGTTVVPQATQPNASLVNLAGYAALWGVFFLVSAVRLGRSARAV